MAANGQTARARSLKRWEPIQLALLSASEAVGAQVSTAASDEADSIVETAGMASRIIFWINASLVVMTVIASVLVFLLVTRPILRLAQSLDSVRRGGSMTPARVYVRELDVLNNAAVELAQAHSELEVARGQLDHMAHTDVLTGLANRRMFEMRARSEFERGQRYAESLSVVVFDIDHFKQINDEYSHEAGDAVLSALGAYLLSTSRNADLPPARIGGEEFALLLPHTTLDAARDAAERIRVGIIQLQIPVNQTATLRFTASFGVACCGPQDQNFQDTLRRADKALYLAKKAGRNRIEAAA
jgi:diguanylate cyclase (GGDEF)-like protein